MINKEQCLEHLTILSRKADNDNDIKRINAITEYIKDKHSDTQDTQANINHGIIVQEIVTNDYANGLYHYHATYSMPISDSVCVNTSSDAGRK